MHSDVTSAPCTASLEQLEAGELQVIFAVDMFNEGVDLPHVDTILMLRPTESRSRTGPARRASSLTSSKRPR